MLQPKAIWIASSISEDKEKTHWIYWIVWIYINTPFFISTQLSSNINSRRASINLLISFQATHLASQLLEERPEDVAAQRLFKFGKPSGCDWGGFWWDFFKYVTWRLKVFGFTYYGFTKDLQ